MLIADCRSGTLSLHVVHYSARSCQLVMPKLIDSALGPLYAPSRILNKNEGSPPINFQSSPQEALTGMTPLQACTRVMRLLPPPVSGADSLNSDGRMTMQGEIDNRRAFSIGYDENRNRSWLFSSRRTLGTVRSLHKSRSHRPDGK